MQNIKGFSMQATTTSAIHDNQQPNETMTQCLHRMRDDDETMTHEARDLVEAANGSTPIPAPPTGFAKPTATAVTATGGQVNWTAPTGGDPITGYSVAVDDGGTPITGSPFAMAGSTLKKVLTGLTAATAYNVVVTATNGDGSIAATALTLTTTA